MPSYPDWRVVPVYSVYPPFPQLAMTSLTTRVRLSEAESHRLVNRLKNTNLDKFHVICKMHLCFLLHLPGSSLEEFLNDNRTTTCSGQHQTHHTPATDKHKFRYFGRKKSSKDSRSNDHQPITQLTIDQIQPLIDYLDSESNIKQEGLFRKSGHLGRQKLLRDKLQNGADIREELDTAVYTAHDCASVLKAFLSELPEPILTERHYKAHCQIPEMKLESKQLQTLQLLLQLLPAKNFHLLRCLLTLLHKVALEPANKMTSDNLGTLFAPHLLMPRRMSPSELQMAAADMSKMVTFMIDNVHELFKLPQPVIRDIATYWTQMEESMMRSSVDDGDGMARPYHGQLDTSDPPVYTSVTFADRQASQQAATQTDTQMALAELYAHVSAMPSSSKKRRLLKQFNKASITTNTSSPVVNSDRSKRTRLFGDSIKKIVGRSHRRHLSHQGYLIQQGIHDIHTTPVTRATNTHRTTAAGHITKLPSNNQVHIVDMKENHDPKACLKPMRRQDSPTRTCVLLAQTAYTPSCMTPALSMTLTNSHRTEVTPMEVPSRSRFHGKQARSPVRGTPDCRFERPTAFLSPITRTFNKACLTVKANVMTPRSRAPVAVIRTP